MLFIVIVDRKLQLYLQISSCNLALKHACMSGISFGMDDMVVPKSKDVHINSTLNEVKEFEAQYSDGLITYGEKYNKVIDALVKMY